MKPLQIPNIPRAGATLCAVSAGAQGAIEAIERLGIETLPVGECGALPWQVASHADMLLNHAGGREIFAAQPDAGYCRTLSERGFEVIPAGVALGRDYPLDTALNIACVGEVVFIGRRCPGSRAAEFYRRTRRCVPVGQGYARCSVCVISASAIITADGGICAAARENGLDALPIRPGGIHIDGYDTGFIGGCCGLIAPDTLAFCGDVSLLPDGENIRAFAREHGVFIEPLTGGVPEDIGGILPLMQADT